MKHIKEFLPHSTSDTNTISWKQYLIQHWQAIIGDLNDQMMLEKIHGNTLTIGVYDSCWLQELHLLSPIIIQKINTKLDKPYIKELRLKYSAQKTSHHQKILKKSNQANKPMLPDISLALSTKQQDALDRIQDNDLQQALYSFLIRCTRK